MPSSPGGHPWLQRMTNWISGVITDFTSIRVLHMPALYQMQNQVRLEILVGVTNFPQELMDLLKSHHGFPLQLESNLNSCSWSPKPRRSWPLQTSPPYLSALPLTSSLCSPPTPYPFKVVPISGPVNLRQAWKPHLQDLQITPPQKGPPQPASRVTL